MSAATSASTAASAAGRAELDRDLARRLGAWTVLALLFVGVWELLTRTETVNPILLSPPADVYRAFVDLLSQGWFWHHVSVSAREMVFGWSIAVVAAVGMALLFFRFPRLERAAIPYVVTLQALPKVVLLPLFTVVLGLGMGSTIALIVISAFFPTFLNAMVGLNGVPPEAIRLMQSLRASPGQRFRRLFLPHSAPLILTGMQASMVIAALATVIGEFHGARYGVGYVINANAYAMRIPYVYAAIAAISLLSLAMFGAVTLLRRALVPWESGH